MGISLSLEERAGGVVKSWVVKKKKKKCGLRGYSVLESRDRSMNGKTRSQGVPFGIAPSGELSKQRLWVCCASPLEPLRISKVSRKKTQKPYSAVDANDEVDDERDWRRIRESAAKGGG